MGVGPAVELGEVLVEVLPPFAGGVDHRAQALRLRLEGLDLAVDPLAGILEDRAPLPGVVGGAEPLPVPLARGFILEELSDLAESENPASSRSSLMVRSRSRSDAS